MNAGAAGCGAALSPPAPDGASTPASVRTEFSSSAFRAWNTARSQWP